MLAVLVRLVCVCDAIAVLLLLCCCCAVAAEDGDLQQEAIRVLFSEELGIVLEVKE